MTAWLACFPTHLHDWAALPHDDSQALCLVPACSSRHQHHASVPGIDNQTPDPKSQSLISRSQGSEAHHVNTSTTLRSVPGIENLTPCPNPQTLGPKDQKRTTSMIQSGTDSLVVWES